MSVDRWSTQQNPTLSLHWTANSARVLRGALQEGPKAPALSAATYWGAREVTQNAWRKFRFTSPRGLDWHVRRCWALTYTSSDQSTLAVSESELVGVPECQKEALKRRRALST